MIEGIQANTVVQFANEVTVSSVALFMFVRESKPLQSQFRMIVQLTVLSVALGLCVMRRKITHRVCPH